MHRVWVCLAYDPMVHLFFVPLVVFIETVLFIDAFELCERIIELKPC